MTLDRYAVIGNPISHSRSPAIHAEFARQTGEQLSYEALLAPLDGFRDAVERFRRAGGRGMNVTVPFKLEAFALVERCSPRARAAGAVNTLAFGPDGIFGDNTDGAGLLRDLVHNLDRPLEGQRILLLGAGGAARGGLLPLLAERPASLTLANRSVAKAHALAAAFRSHAPDVALDACGFIDLTGRAFDVVINATAASLANEAPQLPPGLYAANALAYDMMYGRGDTPFLAAARNDGVTQRADGLGMLVEQAAESFLLWRGVRPDTAAVLAALRRQLAGE
ncbi:shikimate dehydrogenase [Aromatoleum buckelii]|uniref:Shikimate dehydrogenase (NADP(+)) n=1 Tax=Aromatoleum buckelii TaxID=200254 RepID=A0ABX1N3M9_9RHOO|nr:shikimate dehydrogenase [Aromatoleum buckelii]MCK0511826.1 shikimate dehydrogenase [Aromatoleum buckelii]